MSENASVRPPLTTAAQIEEMARILEKESIIGFDTEFIRESTFYPQLEILQVATRAETWLIDVPAFRKDRTRVEPMALKPLFDIFRNPKILKIVHAAQADQECLLTSFGALAEPVLDTEVAASLTGNGDGVGLAALLKNVLGVAIKKGHARTDWSVRPLPATQIEYAHLDVKHLVELGEKLLAALDRVGRREWALKSSLKWNDPLLHEPTPEMIADRLARGGRVDRKGYPVLVELVRWRERRVREINVPRRWLADDAVLMDLAQVKPKDVGHLSSFRGLNRGELKQSGKQIIDLIEAATHMEISRPQGGSRGDPATAEEGRAMDLLKCYVGILADQNRVAVKNLLLVDQMLRLLRAKPKTKEELLEISVMNPQAVELIGKEVIDFLHGRITLSVVEDRVRVSKSSES